MLSPVDALLKCKLFTSFELEHLEIISSESVIRHCEEGELLWLENSFGTDLMILMEGSLAVLLKLPNKEDFVLRYISSVGSFVGEHGWWSEGEQSRSRSIKATKRTTLLVIPQRIRTLVQELAPHLGDLFEALKIDQAHHSSIMFGAQLCHRLLTTQRKSKHLRLKPGAMVFKQGSRGRKAFLIIRGEAEVWQHSAGNESVFVERLHTGQMFGEKAVFENRCRTASVVAKTKLELLEIDRADLMQLSLQSVNVKEYFSALRHIEWIDEELLAIQFLGELEGDPAFVTVYYRDDYPFIIGFRAIGTHRYSAQVFDRSGEKREGTLVQFSSFSTDPSTKRELGIKDQSLCSIEVKGTWSALQELQHAMLFQTPISEERLDELRAPHALSSPNIEKDQFVCSCLQVSQSLLMECYNSGARSVAELIERTNAGTACGGCLPALSALCQQSFGSLFHLHEVIERSSEVSSFGFKGTDEEDHQYALPGQHIILSINLDGSWISRPYSLTNDYDQGADRQITVKRVEKGRVSSALFSESRDTLAIKISQPRGNFTIDPKGGPSILFFAAGIGITPAKSFSSALAALNYPRSMILHHSAREESELIFKEYFLEHTALFRDFQYIYRVTSIENRLTEPVIHDLVQDKLSYVFYICGPSKYIEMVRESLRVLGVSNDYIYSEYFTSPPIEDLIPSQSALRGLLPVGTEDYSSNSFKSIRWMTLSGILFYLIQDYFSLFSEYLAPWQGDQVTRIWTGFTCVLYLFVLWWLPFNRAFGDPKHLIKIKIHRTLGSIAPLLLFLHASHIGYGALCVLSLSYVCVAASGCLEVSPQGSPVLKTVWLSAHISLSVLMISLLALHIYTVMAFQ